MAERLGRQEPTFSFALPYVVTDGEEAVELYGLSGRDVFEWQKSLIYDILARNEDGRWTHSKFGYSVPRRNGKGEVLIIRELYGLAYGEKIMHTAHRADTSHAAWERLCEILDKIEVPYKQLKAKGRELIQLENGGKIEFRTRTSKGGLGEGYDLLVIDEAQEYQTDQESTLKYIVSDSDNPQTIMCGTPPTPISAGTVFVKFRASIMDGKTENFGWAEWSVEKMSDVKDRELWYETNPSLGKKLTERDIADEFTEGEELDFNIQRLGLWIEYNLKSAISQEDWNRTLVKKLPQLVGKLSIGIKYHRDGGSVSLAIAAKTKDEKVFVEVIGNRPVREGNDWLVAFCEKVGKNANKIIVDGQNGQEALKKALKSAEAKRTVLPTTRNVIEANALFEQNVFEEKLVRMNQPSLTGVVTNTKHRPIGTNGGFGYTELIDDYDVSIMDAAILAAWATATMKEGKKQRVGY